MPFALILLKPWTEIDPLRKLQASIKNIRKSRILLHHIQRALKKNDFEARAEMFVPFYIRRKVMTLPCLSKDQIAAAREMDLLTYLRRFEPDELVYVGSGTYTTRTHDSLKISNGKWCWWSRNIGGTNALDYLTRVEGLSFLDAVQRILGELPCVPTKSEPTAPLLKTEFTLPPKHADNRRVFAYLRSRGIDAEIINHCIKHGQLYEDAAHHNCVFVGYRNDKPAYGALRGTLSDSTFAGEVPGSDKRFSFAVPRCAGGKTLCVFESAIDALSYLTLLKLRGQEWRAANTLSLSGIYQPRKDGSIRSPVALEQYLKDNPGVTRIVLCLDNDGPGRAASAAIQKCLPQYEVIDNPPRRGKDYNDQLRLVKGISGRVRTRGGDAR